MSLFTAQRGRLVLLVLVFTGVAYLLVLGTVFDSLGGVPMPGWKSSQWSSSSPKDGEWSPSEFAAERVDRLENVLDIKFSPACENWDPHGPPEDDPPDCLRAKQFREIQEFRKLNFRWEGHHVESQTEAINHLELCVLGFRICPERPLIITDYWYAFKAKTSTSGEGIWMDPIVETMVDLGFSWFPMLQGRLLESWNLTRIFEHSLHMYWTVDNNAFQCLTNPRCVRQEDFHQHPTYVWNLSDIPAHEFGRLPAWRVFAPSFWGTRPQAIGYPGVSPLLHWGQGKKDPMQEWSVHVLGQKWQLVPYDYPGHTWIPLTIEQTCLSAPSLPWDKRKKRILILAKRSAYFYEARFAKPLQSFWPTIVAEMAKDGYELVTVANEEKGFPIPDGIVKLGSQSKHSYELLVATSRALMGIGLPEISPSPYNAICAGVPAVMPYWQDKPVGDGWYKFSVYYAQHGPVNAIGEPYSYPYNSSDVEDVLRQLRKAVSTPIGSYIPPEMRLSNVRKVAADFFFHDWEAEYEAVKKATGGKVPEYDPVMWEMCIKNGKCLDPRLQGQEGQEHVAHIQ